MLTKFCPVKLSPEELQIVRSRLSDLVSEYAVASEQSESEKADMAARKKESEKNLEELRQRVFVHNRIAQSGVEMRTVECIERGNIETWRIETVRLDEGTVVDSRPMTEAERAKYAQKDLFGDEQPKQAPIVTTPPQVPKAIAGEELPIVTEPPAEQRALPAVDALEVAEQWAQQWVHDPTARTDEHELAGDWGCFARDAGIDPAIVPWKRTIKEATGCVKVRDGSGYNCRRYTQAELDELAAKEARPVNASPVIDV